MSIVDGLGFRERESVGGIAGVQAQHGGHDLPSFRPPKEKPYVLLVRSRLMGDYSHGKMRSCQGFGCMRVEVPIPRVPPSLYSRGWVSDPLGVGYKLESKSYAFLKGTGPGPCSNSMSYVGRSTFLPRLGLHRSYWSFPIDPRVNWAWGP